MCKEIIQKRCSEISVFTKCDIDSLGTFSTLVGNGMHHWIHLNWLRLPSYVYDQDNGNLVEPSVLQCSFVFRTTTKKKEKKENEKCGVGSFGILIKISGNTYITEWDEKQLFMCEFFKTRQNFFLSVLLNIQSVGVISLS